MFWDKTIILVLPVMVFAMWAQHRVRTTYQRYLQVQAGRGLSGSEAARRLLDAAGLHDVEIEQIDGLLTDHYDPRRRTLFLSRENYHGRSVAALGVACHEAGHAAGGEFDASNRAIRLLAHHGIVTRQEQGMVKQVLGAAALTYVAGALMAVAQLVRLVLLRGGRY